MGLDQFKADVAEAKDNKFPGVISIRRGDSDGEFSLSFTHETFTHPLEIQILALDVGSYPKVSNFMVFTTSEDVEESTIQFVERVSGWAQGKRVQQIVATISDKLSSSIALEQDTDSEHDGVSDDAMDLDDLSEGDESDSFNSFDKDDGDLREMLRPKLLEAGSRVRLDRGQLRRLKKDLEAAKVAGVKVGILPHVKIGFFEFISLSIRIKKLGIPHDSLEAWGLKASDYAVLLLRFPQGYPTIRDFVQSSSNRPMVEYRFGKCATVRPALHSARVAFGDKANKPESLDLGSEASCEDAASFATLHVSKSIDALLNEFFPLLLSIRLNKKLRWNQAQAYLTRVIEAGHSNCRADNIDVPDLIEECKEDNDPIITENAYQALNRDYAMVNEHDLSIPLVSMQFALRRIARCTQFCMNCHQRIQGEFESVKPELCSRELCQYQYLSLGLGVGIEHEVINNPFVVDLLVSFFYASLKSGTVRALPQGLSLKHYRAGFVSDMRTYVRADACYEAGTMSLKPGTDCIYDVEEGDLVVLVHNLDKRLFISDYADLQNFEKQVCRITTRHGKECTFQTRPQETLLTSLMSSTPDIGSHHDIPTRSAWQEVLVYRYHQDIDDPTSKQSNEAFQLMANGIPSVLNMRDYLLPNPGRSLKSWNRMHPSSLALLNWIVASNRSLIVQDEDVPSDTKSVSGNRSDESNRVKGMDPHWMQFRFAQGSREKEQLFSKALASEFPADSDFQTRFAWHGSPLANWHSIIRTGLDFNTTAHGRACGDGVYLSRQFSVSQGYTSKAMYSAWPNSQLMVSQAISICEVVNRPCKFVSSTPHYVVSRLDWIQCRYLFVGVEPTQAAANYSLPRRQQKCSPGYAEQEPGYEVIGPTMKPIEIPVSILSPGRRDSNTKVVDGSTRSSEGKKESDDSYEDIESSDNDDDYDLDLLDIDNCLANPPSGGKRPRRQSEDSNLGASIPPKLSTPRHQYETPRDSSQPAALTCPVTAFRPGELDLDSLPKLPEPTWAASSASALQRLTRDIKDLQKTQLTTSLPTLGWFVDFDKLNNLFHWIVELHSFDTTLPLAQDMAKTNCTSIILELRFGITYPISPPFVRVVRPRFLPFMQGGGGHITIGGAVCSELLTNSGWSPALSLEKVFLEVRLNLTELDPPARLEKYTMTCDYGVGEAVAAYKRVAAAHGWAVSKDLDDIASLGMDMD